MRTKENKNDEKTKRKIKKTMGIQTKSKNGGNKVQLLESGFAE